MFSYAGKSSGVQPTAPTTDPYFNQVACLLHCDGTNGAQNNTFLDSSSNNFTVTRFGSATQGTFTPFSQAAGYWSNYFPTASYLTVATNAAFTYATNDFTIECWVYLTTTGAIQYIIDQRNSGTANAVIPAIYVSAANVLTYFVSNAAQITGTTALKVGTWYHVAVSRSTLVTKMFLNGTQEGSSYVDANNYAASRVTIASNGATAGNYLVGYVSNARLVNGTAVYTSNFTPPTTPLTAITNTKLLTCQSNRFVDNSSNNFAFTVTGTPSTQPWSAFAPTSAYSTATNGGSCYFNGTTDYLTIPNSSNLQMGTGNFTMEFWIYPTNLSASVQEIYTTSSATATNQSYSCLIQTATIYMYLSSTTGGNDIANAANPIGTLKLNQWHHIAIVRNGTTFTGYLNGVAGTTATSSLSLFNFTSPLTIANTTWTAAYQYGYLSNIRIVKGTAVYTSNFTPPTTPLTAISGTQLLLSGTNAGIYDNAGKSDLVTASNPKVSTTQVKYGTGSVGYAASSNGMTVPSQPYTTLGTANFTIEFWLYLNSTANGDFYDQRSTGTQVAPVIQLASSALTYYVNNVTQITGTALSTGQWYHVAVCRSGTNTRLFVNGTQQGSTWTTDSSNYVANPLGIGAYLPTPTNSSNCYLDDIRITNGIARYTANFTPPTSAFPNQ